MVLALTLALTSAALAQVPAPGGPFNSAFRVQNLEASDATCSYSFYDSSGTSAFDSTPETVAPGDSLYVYVPDVSGLGSGSYSAVVSCDKKVAAVTNFSDADSGASHEGITEPAMEWFAPGIYNNFYNYYSNVVVQNASGGAVDITVEIFEPGNATPVATQTEDAVPANAAVSFSQEGLAGLVTNQFYSAKISGTGNIAPIVNIYGKGTVDNQLYSYNAFKSGSLVAYAPIIMNKYYTYDTSLVVQNIGDAAAAVTVTYIEGTVDNYTIQPGAAESIYTPSILPAGNTLYGATVESDQPIVVLVNQSNANNRAASYTGFAGGSGEMRAPIVMKNYYTYDSSVVCQNIGGAATTMTIEYAGIATTTTSPSIAAGQVHQFYQPNDPALAGVAPNWISSATVTAGGTIICVVNQDNIPSLAGVVHDQLYSYEGIAP
jgi:hypothetical protein